MRKRKAVKWTLHSRVRSALRKVWQWSPMRREALQVAKSSERGKYVCALCWQIHKAKDVHVDHIEAVGPTPGSRNAPKELTWDEWFGRLFCSSENLRVVCVTCHAKITKAQRKKK